MTKDYHDYHAELIAADVEPAVAQKELYRRRAEKGDGLFAVAAAIIQVADAMYEMNIVLRNLKL